MSILLLRPSGEGVFLRELEEGDGKLAREGARITIEFVASTLQGRELANTEKRGLPYVFPYRHQTDVWTRMVKGMKVRGKRLVLLFPEAAYGPKGVPGIVPPNEPLLVWLKMTSTVPVTSSMNEDPADQGAAP